jgi:hypothetical protein
LWPASTLLLFYYDEHEGELLTPDIENSRLALPDKLYYACNPAKVPEFK